MSPFTYVDLELTLSPTGDLFWPRARRGTILRGAFGAILRDVACDPLCAGAASCAFADECAYRALFAPEAPADATRLRKNKDRPRPFVFEPNLTGPELVPAGGEFRAAVRLFGVAAELYGYVIVVFAELLRRGLGRERVRCELRQVRAGGRELFGGGRLATLETTAVRQESMELVAGSAPASAVEVRFVTPAYLKDGGREVRQGREAFGPLVRRARDRISSLYRFYCGDEDLEDFWPFAAIGAEADEARCLRDGTTWLGQTRRSTRTGQIHDLSGLTGSAVYENAPPRALRILELAELTHVGKHATFGLGRVEIQKRM